MTTGDRTLLPLTTVEIAAPRDVVRARQRARQLAALLGFGAQDQSRVATATSEICRNAANYAGGGRCEFLLDSGKPALVVRVADEGPGIPNLDEVLAGRYSSPTGMGLGLSGTRRLMDRFAAETRPGRGTQVTFAKELPAGAKLPQPFELVQQLARQPQDLDDDLRQADHELLRAIAQLRSRNDELEQIRNELEETNRGVVALYAELDQKADSLRKANELKSRFLSNMSHEFRTPLNSVQSLARLLLEGVEGPLTEGQRRALELIRGSAANLTEMVNDLLDLAKIEAGKIAVRPQEFEAAQLFGSLRGVLRPLARDPQVTLAFDPPPEVKLFTDDAKVSQILRNFASNALKFTERGEVRMGGWQETPETVTFFVRDTGIGIAKEDQERIFEEFTQVEGALQKRVKGTGLGLPLSRKLAQLLGGEIRIESEPGRGSTFFLRIPVRWVEPKAPAEGQPVLAVADDAALLAQWERLLQGTRYRLVPARTPAEAREALRMARPLAAIAAGSVAGSPSRSLLAELKALAVPVLGLARTEAEAFALAADCDRIVRRLEERHELLEALAGAVALNETGAARGAHA